MFTLRTESLAILGRKEEAEDHVPEVTWICIQRVHPVLKSNRVRVAPQVTEVLHCDKCAVEELLEYRLAFGDVAQHLSARHLTRIQRRDERRLIGHRHFCVRLER